MHHRIRHLAAAAALAGVVLGSMALQGCVAVPEGVRPVQPFQLGRYLGRWYEIARLDHRFERGLDQVTATYRLRPDDGGVHVLNRGLDTRSGQWKDIQGRAYPVRGVDQAYLKVSFFGPFYGAYVVFDLDPQYRHALVAGPDKSYLWILSRTPVMTPQELQPLLDKARAAGFDTSRLIYPAQTAQAPDAEP